MNTIHGLNFFKALKSTENKIPPYGEFYRKNLKMQLDMVTHPYILYRQYISMIKTRVCYSVYYMRHETE